MYLVVIFFLGISDVVSGPDYEWVICPNFPILCDFTIFFITYFLISSIFTQFLLHYFYLNFRAHCSRIVSKKLTLSFLGGQPMTFKPGMPLEGQVSVLFNNYISLKKEEIEKSKLTLTFKENRSGNVIKQLVFRGSSERVFNRWVSILPIIAYM